VRTLCAQFGCACACADSLSALCAQHPYYSALRHGHTVFFRKVVQYFRITYHGCFVHLHAKHPVAANCPCVSRKSKRVVHFFQTGIKPPSRIERPSYGRPGLASPRTFHPKVRPCFQTRHTPNANKRRKPWALTEPCGVNFG
jgi:hypothetical protein